MAVWTIWEHGKFDDPAAEARFVRDAFSWWALLLGPLWPILNGMWLVALAAVAVEVGLGLLAAALTAPFVVVALYVVVGLWFAFEARALRRWSLSRRGWRMTAVVEAKTFREAERRYFAGRAELPPDVLPGGPVQPDAGPSGGPGAGTGAGGFEAGPWGAPVIGVMPESER